MRPRIYFTSADERKEIRRRGLAHLKQGKVPKTALLLGEKYKHLIGQDISPEVEIRWCSEEVGHGVFTQNLIAPDQYIGEYIGLVRQNIRFYFTPLNNYCFEYPIPDATGRHYVIDATDGNFTRFINHSNQPNLRAIHVFVDGFYHLIFLSARAIQAQEQLSYDYGPNYWALRSPPQPL